MKNYPAYKELKSEETTHLKSLFNVNVIPWQYFIFSFEIIVFFNPLYSDGFSHDIDTISMGLPIM